MTKLNSNCDKTQKLKGPRDLDKYKSSERLLKRVDISLSLGFYKRCLKCWNLRIGTKKTRCFFCTCFVIIVLSWNSFYTFDFAMSQLSFSHEKSLRLGSICHVCGNSFRMKCYIRKHSQKKHHIFFGSRLEISTFQTFFTKSKTLIDCQFFP